MENTKDLNSSLQINFEHLLELVSKYELQTNQELTRKVREIRDELLMFGTPDDLEEEQTELAEEV